MSKILDIIALFRSAYFSSYSGREIARKLSLNPQTVLNNIHPLMDQKIFLSKEEGRNKKYSLNFHNFQTILLLGMAESAVGYASLDNFELKKIIEELIPFAETLVVFGSFAKGTEKEDSDVDLLVISPTNKERIKKRARSFPREINIEFITWNQLRSAIKDKKPLAIEIQKHHIVYGNVLRFIQINL